LWQVTARPASAGEQPVDERQINSQDRPHSQQGSSVVSNGQPTNRPTIILTVVSSPDASH